MSAFLTLMMRNSLQQFQILHERQRQAISRQVKRSFSQEDRIAELENHVGELQLILAAAMNLLVSKGVLSTEELVKAAHEVDMMDGVVDGQLHGNLSADGQVAPPPLPPDPLKELQQAMGVSQTDENPAEGMESGS